MSSTCITKRFQAYLRHIRKRKNPRGKVGQYACAQSFIADPKELMHSTIYTTFHCISVYPHLEDDDLYISFSVTPLYLLYKYLYISAGLIPVSPNTYMLTHMHITLFSESCPPSLYLLSLPFYSPLFKYS